MIKYVKLTALLWEEKKSAMDVLFFPESGFLRVISFFPVREAVLIPGDERSLS